MLLERSQLETMKMTDLRSLNLQMGGQPTTPATTKDMLINQMILNAAKQPVEEAKVEDVKIQPVAQVETTIEEVIKAVNPFILRGMKVFHDAEGKTWLFRVQKRSAKIRDTNTGEVRVIEVWADDSGTLKQPLNVIRRCASVLMQGAASPAAIDKPKDPSNSYTAVA